MRCSYIASPQQFVGQPTPAGATTPGASTAAAGEAGAQSAVQGVPNAMQGFSQNRDQPIQIEAASLEMRDKKKEATFAGNVKVVQGDTTMTSKTLVVFYDSGPDQAASAPATAKGSKSGTMQSATPGPGGSSSIRRLEARGSVVVTQKEQVVTGDTAIFEPRANLTTMGGGVVLTQCKNVMRGDRLVALVAQQSDTPELAGPEHVHQIATAGVIHQLMRSPDGTVRLVIQGLERIRLGEFIQTEPYLKARVSVAQDEGFCFRSNRSREFGVVGYPVLIEVGSRRFGL